MRCFQRGLLWFPWHRSWGKWARHCCHDYKVGYWKPQVTYQAENRQGWSDRHTARFQFFSLHICCQLDTLHFCKVDTRSFVTLEAFTARSIRLGLSHLLFTINLRGRWYFCLCSTGVYYLYFPHLISEKTVAQKIKWPVQCYSSTKWWEIGNLTKELVQLMVQYTILFP